MKNAASIIFRSALILLLGVTIGLLIGDRDFTDSKFNFSSKKDNKLSKVLQMVNQKYVDSVNTDSIEGETINKVLQQLDPHSVYLPPQQAQSVNERLEGGFDGIGVEYQLLRDTLYVTQLYPGSPALKAGLANGDKVLRVNGKPFSGTKLTPEGISQIFRGTRDSKIVLNVVTLDGKAKNCEIKRGHVELSSLDAAYMVSSSTGYIKISKFATTTDSDFRKALKRLKLDGLEKLILDLRGNGGGYLNTATALADEFLPKGKLIVYTRGVHEPRTDYFATDSGNFENGKLAILIDEHSASASEILAGALQDLDRAVIVGRRSFGKGLVQEQIAFNDGSAVNLTVARYYTPSGRSIQKSYKKGAESYRNELAERVQKGELYSAQNNLEDSIFKNKPAYHTTKGKAVYSGGGIMPDIFVPVDTNRHNQVVYQLNSEELYSAFVLDKLHPVLKQYPNIIEFINHYQVSEQEFNSFINYAQKTIKYLDIALVRQSKERINLLLKAHLARFKWGNDNYYHVANMDDVTLQKAVAAIN